MPVILRDDGGPAFDPGIDLFGRPTPPPAPPSAPPTLGISPTVSTTPAPGGGIALDFTGRLNASIPVTGGELAYVELNSPQTVSATTDAGATSVITDTQRDFDGRPIWIEFFAPVVDIPANAGGNFTIFVLFEDGSSIGRLGALGSASNVAVLDAARLRRRHTPTFGPHTYAVKAFRTTANCTVTAASGGSGNYFPGYLLITRA